MQTTPWIWTPEPVSEKNAFVRFRTEFTARAAEQLLISADSRYWLWLNGEFLGSGPVRSWVNHWKYDAYDLSGLLRKGKNTLAVLVNHWGTGNFQYLPANPGLWVGLTDAKGHATPLLEGWKSSFSRADATAVPRTSVQQGFEEQFDARLDEPWREPGFDAAVWPSAVKITPPHPDLEPSGIPLLTRERILPRRVVKAERIAPAAQTWTLDVRRLILPEDLSSQLLQVRGFLFTRIWSERAQEAVFMRPHHHSGEILLNGKTLPTLQGGMEQTLEAQSARLKAGWNPLVVPYPDASSTQLGYLHLAQFVLTVRAKGPLKWSATGAEGGPAWGFAGPFAFTEAQEKVLQDHMDFPRVSVARPTDPAATAEAFETLHADAGRKIDFAALPYFQPLPEESVLSNGDAFALACLDCVTGPANLENADALLSDNAEWALLHPGEKGEDVRVLLDYGREVVGPHDFELDAPEGTVVDFFNFEFIQPDGRENYAEGMNNSLRYVCKGGRQRYRSLQRRGLQYSYVIFRNLTGPVRLRSVAVEFATYPQRHAGHFASSDALLDRIWEVGAHTLRCCAEDTYTDCPTYEQTHWVGDSRNEALVDWVINGDPRLWFRCLEQIGQSLELPFNSITASQTPSAWPNLLPAWSFLWMRSCREYLLWTGDSEGAARLLPWVEKNVEGVEAHVNAEGLFEFQGWNMFDWAAMDTPSNGVITHLNCFAVLALNDCAELARWLKKPKAAARFTRLAAKIAAAVNRHLWSAEKKAYIDCIHADGTRSKVFSQQTATVALISGVATGDRAKRCREIVHRPPRGFVKAGSPFFEFFLLEVLKEEHREKAFLDTIRKDWGFMIEQGATTFWELWSLRHGRLTRSHCHGWSAAPTFFLSSTVLGIEPLKPGFAEVRIAPQLGDLAFARGTMPTPFGPIEVSARRVGKKVEVDCRLPKGVRRVE
ncbi:MAG: family 78 glycoside hydrolase catalytic domain [Chthoniobacteraceae bacterium]